MGMRKAGRRVAVTAFGVDRPGIVAAVTGVLTDRGGNLEDTSMTILRGHFAMMLVVAVPDSEDAAGLEEAIIAATEPLELTVVVRPIADDETGAGEPAGHRFAISLYGADRPGIVHRVARLLAEHEGNIVDLSTRVVGDPDDPAYVMLLDVVLGDDRRAADQLAAALEGVATDLGVEIHVRPDDADVL